MNDLLEHGFCQCCHNNPAYFDKGLCHYCFGYMNDKLAPEDVIVIMSSLIHRLKKAGDERYKDIEAGLVKWVYGHHDG